MEHHHAINGSIFNSYVSHYQRGGSTTNQISMCNIGLEDHVPRGLRRPHSWCLNLSHLRDDRRDGDLTAKPKRGNGEHGDLRMEKQGTTMEKHSMLNYFDVF
jgi:hypothetical protein